MELANCGGCFPVAFSSPVLSFPPAPRFPAAVEPPAALAAPAPGAPPTRAEFRLAPEGKQSIFVGKLKKIKSNSYLVVSIHKHR